MTARILMIQGTGSDVGKSLIVTGLCRLARRRGISVAPFKSQNMSNNAAACADGGEIGRAQALQARAAGLAPRVDFNPVLLKPQSDRRAQIVVRGKAIGHMEASRFLDGRDELLKHALGSFTQLTNEFDLILVEGAGSPAETNLRAKDIANMGFAEAVDAPVCLIGDIDKGGVIASLVGTQAVLGKQDASRIKGFLINKFRGDVALFDDGLKDIERRTGWRSFGVVPWLADAAKLPAEDTVRLNSKPASAHQLKIVAPMLSRLANFDDADPLRFEPKVRFDWVPPGRPIPRDTDVIILFGTKSTLGDLAFLDQQGWTHDIIAHARAGGRVLGICGGFQLLGRQVADPLGIDGPPGTAPGLGLLDVETVMSSEKSVRPVSGACAVSETPASGYEIHAGATSGPGLERPMLMLNGKNEGARSSDGLIEGTYVHGLFAEDGFRASWLARAGLTDTGSLRYDVAVEEAIDGFADGLEVAVSVDALFDLAQISKT